MLRFPNPGSTTSNFVAVYKAIFVNLHEQTVNLDDLVAVTVSENLATSSGYMGSKAIDRSTRTDRSLDPLYNQLKMYAELFRALGWLHSTEESALNFTFTLLGRQIVAAKQHYLPLLEESVLGISYPNHIVKIKGAHDIRPFGLILRTMMACRDSLSRDEMIVGPLSAESDRTSNSVSCMADMINMLREDSRNISEALTIVASNQNVQVNTLRNYTRWPIAIMRDLGWTQKVHLTFRGSGDSYEAHKLTEKGKDIAILLCSSADIRTDQVDALPFDEKAAVSTRAYYSMLERAGFDINSVSSKLVAEKPVLERALARLGVDFTKSLVFSPFQSLSIADVRQIFPVETHTQLEKRKSIEKGTPVDRDWRIQFISEPEFVRQAHRPQNPAGLVSLTEDIFALHSKYELAEEAATAFVNKYVSANQAQFYPLIGQLFELLGFETKISRSGVNYQRWDACVWLDGLAVPIEIKSPTEEEFLSTKAVRQALENKIVLLARSEFNTTYDSTTLIVGYKFPNERGDMLMLINDVFNTFRIRIGVIDFRTLTLLALRSVTDGLTLRPDQLSSLRGFLLA